VDINEAPMPLKNFFMKTTSENPSRKSDLVKNVHNPRFFTFI